MAERTRIDWGEARRRLAEAEAGLSRALRPDGERVAAVRRSRAARLEARGERPADDLVSLLCFRVGGRPFALRLEEALEVVPLAGFVPFPGATAGTLGLVAVRGEVSVVLDGRQLLSSLDDGSEPSCAVRLRAGGGRLALAVDRVERVGAASAADLQPLDPGFAAADLVQSVTADGTAVVDAGAVARRAGGSPETPSPRRLP